MQKNGRGKHTELLAELTQELQQFTRLSASFFRAAAARTGMTVTDMQVLDILENTGPTTAGQLADLTGLTTGAITGMLNRLEEAKLVRRERDPDDGRRVIIQLAKGETNTDNAYERGSIFASLSKAWDELAAQYSDEQLAVLLEFLRGNNALTKMQIARLGEASQGDESIFSTPLEGVESGRFVVSSGISKLTLRTNSDMAELYQARFEGLLPEVKVKGGEVTLRYPRRLWPLDKEQRIAEVKLNAAIPWEIAIQGGAAVVEAKLGQLNLAGFEAKGGLSSIHLDLPIPSGMVPIYISGGASMITIQHPAEVAVRAHLKGWASTFIFGDQTFSNVGNDVRLQSQGYEANAQGYDIEVATSVSMVTITTT